MWPRYCVAWSDLCNHDIVTLLALGVRGPRREAVWHLRASTEQRAFRISKHTPGRPSGRPRGHAAGAKDGLVHARVRLRMALGQSGVSRVAEGAKDAEDAERARNAANTKDVDDAADAEDARPHF